MRLEEYKSSGVVPPSAIAVGLIVGLVAAVVLGSLYAVLIHFNPLIYFSAIASAIFGGLMGIVVRAAMRANKGRNALAMIVVTFIATAAAYAISWLVWTGLIIRGAEQFTWGDYINAMISEPAELLGLIALFQEHGTWTLGRNSNETVSGTFLTLIWAAEALIIFGVAMICASSNDGVFCEECENWCDEPLIISAFAGAGGSARIESRLRAGDFSFLEEAEPLSDDTLAFHSLNLSECAHCHRTNSVGLHLHTFVTNKKGEVDQVNKELTPPLLLRGGQLEALMSRAEAFAERVRIADEAGAGEEAFVDIAAG